ncbi:MULTISPECIES: phage head-tail joining protein [unclassified Haematobacter]|uniref:phage head-tail joining protein n=1 Tax=unclassified Haematobacter TaxID=2640585 RepID=UPI0025BFA565|nr:MULTISPECIES: hypothetical protein [unclassified Haematobacter]
MAVSVEELEGLRDELIRARASGLRSVEYEGKRITYQDDAQMAGALADLETRIRRASTRPSGVVTFATSKGF